MKLEISKRKKFGEFTNTWKLNNTLLNIQWIKEVIKREIRKYLKMIENEDTAYQNLQAAAKAMLGEKFMAVTTCSKKKKKNLN